MSAEHEEVCVATTWARPHGYVASRRVVVRFRDDEVVNGIVPEIDLDEPDFTLEFDGANGGRVAIVPVASVKNILIQRVELESDLDRTHMSTVAIHFWDGEVVHGLLGSEPERRRYGMTLPLVSPALDEIEVLGIPYASVKAIFVSSSESSHAGEVRATNQWRVPSANAPLIDLLGEMRRLAALRTQGGITPEDFARRRREVLARI